MRTSLFSRCLSALLGLILISTFNSAYALSSLGTWTAKNPGLSANENYDIYGMAYGNDTFVIVGQDVAKNKAFTANSPDAKNWTIRSTGSSAELFHSVIFSNGRFIAVCIQPESGNARIWTSDTNGNTWVTRNSDNAGLIVTGGLHAVASDGQGKIVAAGGDPYGKGWITVSIDNGTTWRVVRDGAEAKFFPANKFYGVGYVQGIWYALTTSTTFKSTDGASSWNPITGSPMSDSGLAWGAPPVGNRFAGNETTVVVASSNGPQWSSNNGATWHLGQIATGFSASPALTSAASNVVYADGLFVLSTRNAGDVWVSETGRYWKRWKLPTSRDTFALIYAKKAFWCGGMYEKISKSPAWFKARLGCSGDYPFTLFDAEDGPPNRIGLPQYRVNTASLNLVLEGTLFYAKTLGAPINMRLAYNSKPTADGDATIGPFGKNWRFRYESVVGRFGQEAQIVNGGGRSFSFSTPNGENLDTVTADVTLKAPDGIYDTLVYKYSASTPSFELTLKSSHLIYIYGTEGTSVAVNEGLFYLTGIKDQFGNTTTLTVTPENGRITSLKDQSNRTFNFTYNGSGLCTGISIPGGRSVSLSYDIISKDLTGITDMMGYAGSYIYDEKGFLTSMSSAGKTTTFTYAERPGYNEAGTVENKGDKYLSSITRPIVGTTKYELTDDGDTVKRTSPSGAGTLISNKDGQTTSVKDPLGNVRNTTFNDAKLPSSVTDEKGGVFTYEYDDFGNMTRQTDAMGKSTAYEYDADNHSDLKKVTNALSQSWLYTYNTKYQPTTITTPLGYVTTVTYNPNGRLASIKDALLPTGNTTSFTYDIYGNLWTATPPTGGATTLTYDAQGFRCATMADGNAPANTKTIAWDNNDRLTGITYNSVTGTPSYTNTYDAFGQTGFTDELGNSSTVTRDELGFITALTDPLEHVTQKEYDADSRPSKTIDPLGRATSTSYDNAGRPILFTDARGFKVVQEYDGAGNLVSFKDKNGSETKYDYDKNKRLITTTDPLKKLTTVTRDDLGRAASTKNARLQTVGYEYDIDGRLTKKTVKLTASGAETTLVENTIDANGNIKKQKDAWGTTDATATQYAYDANNRVTSITYPDGKIVGLAYNAGGNIYRITYPDNLIATYTYDNFNRQTVPSFLKNNPGTDLAGESRSSNAITAIAISGEAEGTYTLSYNKRSNIVKILRPNGIQTDYAYDAVGRITQVKHSANAGVDNLFTADYTPDAVGNISSESFTGPAYYSSAQSLTNTALLYNVAGELTKKGTKACVSDADGNLIDLEGGTLKCTYDAENRLTKMVRKAADTTLITTENTYNAAGLRIKRVVTGDTVDTLFYHYLPSGILLFTSDTGGNIIDRHIYGGNALLSTYKANGDWLHYFGDRQGHVRFIADNTGAVLVKYDYLPYGKVAFEKLEFNDAAIDGNPFTYVGGLGVQDDGNGLFYMRNRFYDAGTGRFLHRDPIGFEGGSNLYAYANGNPLRYVDPNGTSAGEWGRWAGGWAWWGAVETAKVGVAAVAGTVAVVYGGVAVPAGIAIGAAVYVGEQAVHQIYKAGQAIKNANSGQAQLGDEPSAKDQGNGNAAVEADDKSKEKQEQIENLEKNVGKEVGDSNAVL
jgi:RHS repeat-associated protein